MPSDLLIPVPVLVLACLFACTFAAAAPPLPDTVEPYPVVGDIAFRRGLSSIGRGTCIS